MLVVKDLHKSFKANSVLHGINLEIPPASFIGLIGPSGSGKSVLLKLLAGILQPDSGQVLKTDANSHIEEVGFLFQEGALFDSMTVLENVTFPLLQGFPRQRRAQAAEVDYDEAVERGYKLLCAVGLGDAYEKMPGQLSGGMKRRLALARSLVHNPELVLLDDPTAGLDPVAASVIMNLIHSLYDSYTPTLIIVSHDLRRLLPNVQRVVALFDGNIVCDCPREELSTKVKPNVRSFIETRFEFSSLDETPSETIQ